MYCYCIFGHEAIQSTQSIWFLSRQTACNSTNLLMSNHTKVNSRCHSKYNMCSDFMPHYLKMHSVAIGIVDQETKLVLISCRCQLMQAWKHRNLLLNRAFWKPHFCTMGSVTGWINWFMMHSKHTEDSQNVTGLATMVTFLVNGA